MSSTLEHATKSKKGQRMGLFKVGSMLYLVWRSENTKEIAAIYIWRRQLCPIKCFSFTVKITCTFQKVISTESYSILGKGVISFLGRCINTNY